MTPDLVVPKPEVASEDEYERVKVELGLDDTAIRDLSKIVKSNILSTYRSGQDRKLAFLMKEREKKDSKAVDDVIEEYKEIYLQDWKDYAKRQMEDWEKKTKNEKPKKKLLERLMTMDFFDSDNNQRDPGDSDYEKHASEYYKSLLKVQKGYGNNHARCRVFAELIRNHGKWRADDLMKAQEIYGDDEDMFQAFVKVVKKDKSHDYQATDSYCKALIDASDVYKKDSELFQMFVDVTLQAFDGSRACRAFTKAAPLYRADPDKVQTIFEIAKSSPAAVETLMVLNKWYGGNPRKFEQMYQIFIKRAKGLESDACKWLIRARYLYGVDEGKFQTMVEIAAVSENGEGYERLDSTGRTEKLWRGSGIVAALADCKNLIIEDPRNFKIFTAVAKIGDGNACKMLANVVAEVRKSPDGGNQVSDILYKVVQKNPSAFYLMVKLNKLHENESGKLEACRKIAEPLDDASCKALIATLKDGSGITIEMFSVFAEVAQKQRQPGCAALGAAKIIYGTNVEKLKMCKKIIEPLDDNCCKFLSELKEIYDDSVEKFASTAEYARMSQVYDKPTIEKFFIIHHRDGLEAAQSYINILMNEAKSLLEKELPVAQRVHESYGFMVRSVFPQGNYSTHGKNLACGDRLEHIEQYKFDPDGYPAEMSGLKGYQLIDGEKEDVELLTEYQRRLGKVRNFIAAREPNNNALQESFIEKVNDLFRQKAEPRFQALQRLSIKEKMIALFVSEAVRKARSQIGKSATTGRGKAYKPNAQGYKPDPAILDLIIEYKYAFCEDMETYVRRTADEMKKHQDTVSQNLHLWHELGGIYGENLKHVLRHDIFSAFDTEGGYKEELEEAFFEMVAVPEENSGLSDSQKNRFVATINNKNIPWEKGFDGKKQKPINSKFDVISKQATGIFMANLKFDNDEESQQCQEKIIDALKVLAHRAPFTAEFLFDGVVPKLVAIRRSYLFKLENKLEDLFSSDITAINQEIAKYEEVVETEMKETSIDGEKHKEVEKSSKKRKIRGYITKTQESANARMGAYLCISGDTGMWENSNYFELVMKDEENGKCVGVCMLLKIQAEDKKRYLWFGPNPFEGFLGQVSSSQCYKYMYDTVTKFANENGFDGVVVPSKDEQIFGFCTNRGGDFPDLIKNSRLRDAKGGLRIVEFGGFHELGRHQNDPYGYNDGALIWERAISQA